MADQEHNQILLNAIKNKFNAQNNATTTNASAAFFIPALKTNAPDGAECNKFAIPNLNCEQVGNLKIPTLGTSKNVNKLTIPELRTTSDKNEATTTNASVEFFIPALKTNPADGTGCNKFATPNLNCEQVGNLKGTATNADNFSIPVLNTKAKNNETKMNQLSNRFGELHVHKEKLTFYGQAEEDISEKSTNIDLTTALSAPNEVRKRRKTADVKVEKFDIPFIDCDKSVGKKTESNKVPKAMRTKCAVFREPSAFSRILNLRYTNTVELHANIRHEFNVKYNIEPFKFDTKSPDDIVLEMLNKIPRRT